MKTNEQTDIGKTLKTYKMLVLALVITLLCVALVLAMVAKSGAGNGASADEDKLTTEETLDNDGYTLEKVVVLSRHNIRSPLSSGDSLLGRITPHEWFEWTSPASQLSVRGGTLETSMGQYFRKWLEEEGLFPENYQPDRDSVRIYANSKQRTIATSRFFTAGLLPAYGEDVEYHEKFDGMDPVFNPQLTYVSDKYDKAAKEEIYDMFTDDIEELSDNYELISDVLDMEDSEAVKEGEIDGFKTDDTKIVLKEGAEPAMEGSLKTACSASDALTLQYFEEADDVKAAFGNKLSEKQWDDISEIKTVYCDTLYSTPLIAPNVANPLLKEMLSEMNEKDREFTFLCGHDSNIVSVLASLQAEDYELPMTIEKKTPIGSKLVLSKWKAADGKEYWDADLVYQTTGQLRNADILTDDDHPAVYDLDFKGLDQNSDGLYKDEDMTKRFEDAVAEYDRIKETY